VFQNLTLKYFAENTHAKMEANVLKGLMISCVSVQMVGQAVDVKYHPQQMNQPKPNQMVGSVPTNLVRAIMNAAEASALWQQPTVWEGENVPR